MKTPHLNQFKVHIFGRTTADFHRFFCWAVHFDSVRSIRSNENAHSIFIWISTDARRVGIQKENAIMTIAIRVCISNVRTAFQAREEERNILLHSTTLYAMCNILHSGDDELKKSIAYHSSL